MSSIIFSLPELYISYKNWVSKNPQLAGDVESTVKWLSYFIAGRLNNSNVLSELVFSLSNLLVLFNDQIIKKARHVQSISSGEAMKLWLTVLEYSEVFIEITAKKIWGSKGKWMVVVVLQFVKCVARLGLLLHHKERIIQNPPISPLKRKELLQKDDLRNQDESFHSTAFTLRRSGKAIRTVNSAPPPQFRTWKPPLKPPNNNIEKEDEQTTLELSRKHFVAETLYIVKPLLHLYSLHHWGQMSWKPWLLSLGIDLTSRHIYKSDKSMSMKLNREQRLELSRRTVALLLYLLRSPYYECYTHDRLQSFLRALGHNIPLIGIVCTPIADYIPLWQDTYFYMWST